MTFLPMINTKSIETMSENMFNALFDIEVRASTKGFPPITKEQVIAHLDLFDGVDPKDFKDEYLAKGPVS